MTHRESRSHKNVLCRAGAVCHDLVMRGPDSIIVETDVELLRWRPTMIDDLIEAVAFSQAEFADWFVWADPMPSRETELDVLRDGEAAFDIGRALQYLMYQSGLVVGSASVLPTDGSDSIPDRLLDSLRQDGARLRNVSGSSTHQHCTGRGWT